MEEIKHTKVCKVCGNELPLDCFNRHGRSSDGYASVCKAYAKKQGGTTNAELAKFTPRELLLNLPQEVIMVNLSMFNVMKLMYDIDKKQLMFIMIPLRGRSNSL